MVKSMEQTAEVTAATIQEYFTGIFRMIKLMPMVRKATKNRIHLLSSPMMPPVRKISRSGIVSTVFVDVRVVRLFWTNAR